MATKSPIVNGHVGLLAEQIWNGGSGVRPFIVNNDLTHNLYVGPQRDAKTLTAANVVAIPPLGGVAWPDEDLWAFSLITAGINYYIIPGADSWAPSPNQIAAQINALGVPPSVGNLTSISGLALTPPGSPAILGTIAANSRIWFASISLAVSSDSTGPGANNGVNAYIKTVTSNLALAIAELAIGGPSDSSAAVSEGSFPGLAVAAGEQVEAIINGGVSVTHCFIRASALVIYSTP